MGDTFPKFRAASVQASPVFLDRQATVEKACILMKEASQNGAKLVVFPETFVPGFPYWIQLDIPSANFHFFKRLFEESVIIPSPLTEDLCRGAREADIYLLMGMTEKVPLQMGTMWSTNLLIDNQGRILGKHRKLVPTFAEKMVWANGDGSGLRVWETDIGRIGTLACGNNLNWLYRYALLAQGEEIHIANYPASAYPASASVVGSHVPPVDFLLANRMRSGSYSREGKVFTITSTSTINSEMVDLLCGEDQKKRDRMNACRAYSSITNPLGLFLAEVEDGERIIYADIDVSEMITARQYHDMIGSYTRMDVVSLNLCQDEDRPLWHITRKEVAGEWKLDMLKELGRKQETILKELESLKHLVAKISGKEK